MKEMVVSALGITFNSKNDFGEYTVSLPEGTEILSVSSQKEIRKDVLQVQLMYSVEDYTSIGYPWKYVTFTVVCCNCSKITIDDHKYIGTITIDNRTFVVFYKEGKLVNKTL